jgi:hypothetical protein
MFTVLVKPINNTSEVPLVWFKILMVRYDSQAVNGQSLLGEDG